MGHYTMLYPGYKSQISFKSKGQIAITDRQCKDGSIERRGGEITLADPRKTENTKPLEKVGPIFIHPDYSDRHVMIGTKLTKELRSALVDFLHGHKATFQG